MHPRLRSLPVVALWSSIAIFAPSVRGEEPALELLGGQWFTGTAFSESTFYVVDGLLTHERPPTVDRTIDLAGGFVVPPFAEAHNHNIEAYNLERANAASLAAGVFYVKNPNNHPANVEHIRATLASAETVDARFANGGLTAPGGHPRSVVMRLIDNGVWTEADGDGAFYHALVDEADLGGRWPDIVAADPDFIKTYLLYSEEHAKRANDPEFLDWRGLDPVLLPEIVRRAHAEGLEVSTHVESAADFEVAVAAGVDEINHMPGFRANPREIKEPERYRISTEAAEAAARNGTVVVTTLSGVDRFPATAEYRRQIDELHRSNLRTLREAGVTVILGSDRYDSNVIAEALYVDSLGVFGRAELLRILCETTAQAIFPERRIGRLDEGYEASLVVLEENPLESFDALTNVRLLVKQGHVLD